MDEEEIPVESAKEIRAIIKESDLDTDLAFLLEPSTPIANSSEIWNLLFLDGGGLGTFRNPDLLCTKSDALRFVNGKLNELRRWKHQVDAVIAALDEAISRVKTSMEKGLGAPKDFEPQIYTGPNPYVDLNEAQMTMDEDEHHLKLYEAFKGNSPRSPMTDEDDMVESCLSRAEDELWDEACLNQDYLELKRKILARQSRSLEEAIVVLEKRYLYSRTNLGAWKAEFSKFEDVKVFRDDA